MVSEKASAMEVPPDQLATLQSRAFQDWLNDMMSTKKIEFHGLKKNYDSYTEAWFRYQITKRLSALSQSASSEDSTNTAQ